MKNFLLLKENYLMAVLLSFLLLTHNQNDLFAQCPEFAYSISLGGEQECDNQGTADPSDDEICINSILFLAFSTPPAGDITFSIGGVVVGSYPAGIQIPLDATYCFPAVVDPYETIVTFPDGCSYTNSFPGDPSLTCSDCQDTDEDGVCDEADQCEGSDDNIDTDGDGLPDGCDLCPNLADLVPGDACPSDGDDCTDDGVVSDSCECTSVPIDSPECNPNGECEVCDSSGNNTCYEYIKKVNFGCDSNHSGDNSGYGDFTDSAWDFHCGYWYGLTLKPGFYGCAYWENWNVWIDWNQDCDFDDADEHIGQACHWGNVYGYVSVPDHALTGNTTMRISMSYDGYADSCDNFEYGEVEDYTLNVICDTNEGGGDAPMVGMSQEYADLFHQAQIEFQENEKADAMLRPGYVGGDIDRREIVTIAKDIDSEAEVMVYPNPASSVVNISLNTTLENGAISIFDSVGRMVSQIANDGENQVLILDVSEYAAGLYTVSVESDNIQKLTKQFVVTR